MTEDEIFHEAVVTPRGAFVPLPDLRRIERPGWLQLVTPSFREGGFNEVAFCAVAAGEADAIIDAALAEYRALGIRFRWVVAPDSAPSDLAERLSRRGLQPEAGWAMAKPLDEEPVAAEPGVTVERIDTGSIDLFTRVMAEGWNVDPAPLHVAHRLALASGRHRLFLARVDGAPAATAGYVAFERSAYLLGGVTLPRYRRRGCYRALVAARLADARGHDLALATSHARAATSGPLLERLGFRVVARLTSFTG